MAYRFTMNSRWSRTLFVALLRRDGLRPYRDHRQRLNTVMARVSRSFVADTTAHLSALDHALHEHIDRITEDIITQGNPRDTSAAEEVGGVLEEDRGMRTGAFGPDLGGETVEFVKRRSNKGLQADGGTALVRYSVAEAHVGVVSPPPLNPGR